MPRVKGRQKGIRQRDSSRRSTNSGSLPRRSIQSSTGSLRRSSRLAEANSHRVNTPTTSPMADVAHQQHYPPVNSRSVEVGIERPSTRRRIVARSEFENPRNRVSTRRQLTPTRRQHDVEPEQNGYVLDFVVGPPSQVYTGSPIAPAVTLQVRTVRHGSDAHPTASSLHQYIAVATLVTPDRNGALMPTTPGALSGPQMADSVHPPGIATAPEILGYISFPDLHVRYAGTYRIRVSLIRMGSAYRSGLGGTTVQTADSGLIDVTNV
ncbi:hypothetical protein EJ08DRAFT_700666 [Tothia fuscella]|uniref:Velvet domain-containing protein n=1 Tax=Tothia fuscella TaxID=1048955 RepID=A0A9P4NJK0_9PEZI|nr:hypothetical protein EJ08DRAFT_700666 [Tothia fuscella]